MANEIHNYPLTATDINDSFFDIDQFNGLAYDTKKVPNDVLVNSLFNNNVHSSYCHLAVQTPASINTPFAIEFSTIIFENGTTLNATDGIDVLSDGTYNVQFSAQLERTSGGASEQCMIWFRVNGIDVINSNTHLTMQANAGKLVGAWNLFLQLVAGDRVQIMYAVTDTDITLLYEPSDLVIPHPATPSMIVTINRV